MHGLAEANQALSEADLILALGCRLSDRIVGRPGSFGQGRRVVQVDLDPVQLNKQVQLDLDIEADVREVLREWIRYLKSENRPSKSGWFPASPQKSDGEETQITPGSTLHPEHIVRKLWQVTEGRARIVTDVGQNQQWVAQFYSFDKGKRNHITSGGQGAMGFALPAGIGTALACPEREVWIMAGDGGFQMTMMELATVIQEKLALKIAILNNGYLGMVRQWQELFYDGFYSNVEPAGPDFGKLARAYGIPAKVINRPEDVTRAIETARETTGPYLLDFQIEREANVFPMIAPGGSLDNMITRSAGSSPKHSSRSGE
jgi:acetolactate synthase-1/2/3 large subunit